MAMTMPVSGFQRGIVLLLYCIYLQVIWCSSSNSSYPAGFHNAALFKPTNQSTTLNHSGHGYLDSHFSVDGINYCEYDTQSCTEDEDNPWWAVDLGEIYNIHNITFFNTDGYGGRVSNITIFVTNQTENIEVSDLVNCSYIRESSSDARSATTLSCEQEARVVIVSRNALDTGDPRLAMCELLVIAECLDGFYGPDCIEQCSPNCANPPCDKYTDDGACPGGECLAGYDGNTCSTECPDGTFGPNCIGNCSSHCADPPCDKYTDDGACSGGRCKAGYDGRNCTEVCRDGTYGANCIGDCSSYCADPPCDKYTDDGACPGGRCLAGYDGGNCTTICPNGTYGSNCIGECSPYCYNPPCEKHTDDGTCPDGKCLAGYDEDNCTTECLNGTYGPNCIGDCSPNCYNPPCEKHTDNGTCPDGKCLAGYDGNSCTEDCRDGTYGSNCIGNCSEYCADPPCDKRTDNGACPGGRCLAGYDGANCTQVCINGTFGENCVHTCSPNCAVPCLYTNGTCYGQCVDGFKGHDCRENDLDTDGANVGAIIGGILAVILLALIIVSVIFMRKKQTDNRSGRDNIKMDEIVVKDDQRPEPEGSSNDFIQDEQAYEPLNTVIQNTDILNYVAHRKKDAKPFSAEYHSIPREVHPITVGTLPENKPKNKYKNIMPYDTNRVLLDKLEGDDFSDYVNASFVKDYQGKPSYIACSGITKVNVNDFWRMIWQYKVSVIVMVTNLIEEAKVKCDKYWPFEEPVCYGDVTVDFKEEVIGSHYTKRSLLATKDGESRPVIQYQYTVWPDKKVPENLSGVCEIREVIKAHRETNDTPVIIHCSAGVGRTGTIIALDILLEQSQGEGHIDIFGCVSELREQRMHMVQTLVQYVFLHDALNVLLTVGSTQIKCEELQKFIQSKKSKVQIMNEYKLLEDVKPRFTDDNYELGKFEYKEKNRDLNVIAADYNRVVLDCSPEVYINAVYVQGNERKREFIATQVPLPNTVEDFWKMVYEQRTPVIVCLESDNVSSEAWLPEKVEEVTYSNITVNKVNTVDTVDKTENNDVNVYDVTISSPQENFYANVNVGQDESQDKSEVHKSRVYDVSHWSDSQCKQTIKLQNLIGQVESWVKDTDSYKPVIVMCLNGASRCGPYIALSRLLSKANTDQHIDVFHVVKEIRINRPQFVESFDDYNFLYTAVAELV